MLRLRVLLLLVKLLRLLKPVHEKTKNGKEERQALAEARRLLVQETLADDLRSIT